MVKPISEHKTTVKAQKRPARDSNLSAVEGGRVRRIVFEDEAEQRAAETHREWRPRHDDDIDDIHFEVDNMGRFARRADRVRTDKVESKTLYETEGGRVREAHTETESGRRKRVLYTTRRTSRGETEERFNSTVVDRVIAGVDAPVLAERSTTKKSSKPAKTTKKTVTRRRTITKGKTTVTSESTDDGTGNAQCLAITSAGKQCRNSCKTGSTYCGAHQGFTPQKAAKNLDTKPQKGVEDTLPGQTGSTATAQCAAYTQAGMQCSRASRKTSKYCGLHKGYRAPSKDQLAERVRTKPRSKKAKDTKPKL